MSGQHGSRFDAEDASSGQARLGTIQHSLFTRPPNNFNKTGYSGRITELVANFVKIEQLPELVVCQYHVEFDPVVDSKAFRHAMLKQKSIQDEIGSVFIFDGMILYLVSNENLEGEYGAEHPVTGEPVKVFLRASVRFNQYDAQTINCYNIIIRNCLDIIGLKRLGRNHYNEARKGQMSSYPMEVWPGFETAVRQYEDQLMLCIENRFKMIRTESVWSVMNAEYYRARNDVSKFRTKIEELFVGETVFARYNNRMYRVTSINYDMTPASTFTLSTGKVISFKNYFETQYNLVIRADDQPILVSEGKAKAPGEAPRNAYLLPELCYPTGLTDAMRKDFKHMKELSQYTRLDPEKRRQSTERLLNTIHGNERCCALLERWGIHLDRQLVSFQSRELEAEKLKQSALIEDSSNAIIYVTPPPTPPKRDIVYGASIGWNTVSPIYYGENGVLYFYHSDNNGLFGTAPQPYVGMRAEWAKSIRTHGNFRYKHLTNWVVIAPDNADGNRLSSIFIEEVRTVGNAMSIQVNYPIRVHCRDVSARAYREAINDAMSRAGQQAIHMMVLILADDSKARYDSLKSWLCTETNIPSQCVQLSTLRGRPQDNGRNRNFGSIVLKIVLQMNCKMGGALWKVHIPMKRTMIVGYDLYHDSTLRGKTIGACVATMDPEYTVFYSQTRPHENPTELGTNLGFFIRRALHRYFIKNNNTLPDRIFLYRDGVGDGQIPYVRDQEVTLVQQACEEAVTKARANHKIMLAFVIVTKKVNMRIFKGKPDSVLSNPDPGTVVDTVVTRPERYDFYLVPQFVNQGTVTPVCYNVIFDDTSFTPDQHQKLAFKLCHLYYNWQGTVRVPAPCQYAHKLAFMVAQSIHKEANEELSNTLFFL